MPHFTGPHLFPSFTMRKRSVSLARTSLLLAIALAASCAAAQTLPVVNGTFDSSAAGWAWFPAQAVSFRPGPDAEGAANSGYVELNALPNSVAHIEQCFLLPQDTPWGVRPDFKYQHNGYRLSAQVAGFPNTNCSGPPLPNPKEAQRNVFDPASTWTAFSIRHLRVPAGSQSIRLGFGISCTPTMACTGKFDSVEATGVLIQDGFED